MISSILLAATEAGVVADTVTIIAVAYGVDATIASVATAVGATNSNSGTSNNNSGGGGGGGGISGGQ